MTDGAPADIGFGRIAPTVAVTDIDRAIGFWCGVLGFDKVFENGAPVGFAIVEHGPAELHLAWDPEHTATTQNVAHLLVRDARAFHDVLQANGTEVVSPIRDADYGMRTFVFVDADGNRFDVGEYLDVVGDDGR